VWGPKVAIPVAGCCAGGAQGRGGLLQGWMGCGCLGGGGCSSVASTQRAPCCCPAPRGPPRACSQLVSVRRGRPGPRRPPAELSTPGAHAPLLPCPKGGPQGWQPAGISEKRGGRAHCWPPAELSTPGAHAPLLPCPRGGPQGSQPAGFSEKRGGRAHCRPPAELSTPGAHAPLLPCPKGGPQGSQPADLSEKGAAGPTSAPS